MKKMFAVLSLVTLLGVSAPAFAAPPPPSHGGGHHIQAGPHYRHEMRRPPHSGFVFHSGFSGYRPYYHSGITGYQYCRCPYCMAQRPMNGAGFYIRF